MFGGNLGVEKYLEMWWRRECSLVTLAIRTASRTFEIGDGAGRCVRRGERGHGVCRGLSLSSSNMGQCSRPVRGEGWLFALSRRYLSIFSLVPAGHGS